MTSSAAILWSAAHNQSALHRSAASEREADAEIDATYGPEGSIPETQPQQAIALALKYPYLLREVQITAPNQVWSTDITYIPMVQGLMYLYGIIDWYSWYLLGWQLSNTVYFN